MLNDDGYLQQAAYSDAFRNIQIIIEQQLPLENCFGELRARGIINSDCQIQINSERDIIRKKTIILQRLQIENDVIKYNSFISVCDVVKPDLAERIRTEIAKEIQKKGLSLNFNPPPRAGSAMNMNASNSANVTKKEPPNLSQGAVKFHKLY